MTTAQDNIYKRNLELLKNQHPETWQIVTDPISNSTGEICQSPDGQLNLKVIIQDKTFYLHPKEDPRSEAAPFLTIVPEASPGVVALVGIGLGYGALELVEQRPNIQNFIFFEPDVGIFIHALTCMDLKSLLKDPRVTLCVGSAINLENVTKSIGTTLQLENIHILKHSGLMKFKGTEYKNFYNKVFDALLSHNMEGATIIQHGDKLFNNRFEHFRTMHHNSPLEELRNVYAGIPAILVAAGPSLDENIHLLSDLKGKAVIICVDSALPALLSIGIHPDFVTSIDYDKYTYEKIASSAPHFKNTALICMPWVDPSVTKKFPADNIFWAFSATPLEKWINTCCGGGLSVGGVGTVAHLNLIAAIVMGCSPSIFIGQDLSYSGDSDHAKNVILGYTEDETRAMKEIDSPRIKGIDGTLLPTRNDFITYKNMFEQIIAANPGHYINSTAEGAHIEGTQVIPLKTVIDKFCTISHDIHFLKKNQFCNAPSITQKIDIELNALLTEIQQIKIILKKNQTILKDTLRNITRLETKRTAITSFSGLSKAIQKKISNIDENNKKIDSAMMIWRILETLTMEDLKQSKRKANEFKKLADDPDMYLSWLQKNLKRLNDINIARNNYIHVMRMWIELS